MGPAVCSGILRETARQQALGHERLQGLLEVQARYGRGPPQLSDHRPAIGDEHHFAGSDLSQVLAEPVLQFLDSDRPHEAKVAPRSYLVNRARAPVRYESTKGSQSFRGFRLDTLPSSSLAPLF